MTGQIGGFQAEKLVSRYDQALQATLAALAAFRALGRRSDIGAGHLHIGNIYYYAGRWSAALAEYVVAHFPRGTAVYGARAARGLDALGGSGSARPAHYLGEVIADAQLCLTCANPPCGMCPAEFSTRLEFARTDENSACGCCGSMTGTRVCAGARDGCDPGAPPLPVGACAPTEGMIGYEPVTRCDEPMAPSGQALVACCAG